MYETVCLIFITVTSSYSLKKHTNINWILENCGRNCLLFLPVDNLKSTPENVWEKQSWKWHLQNWWV